MSKFAYFTRILAVVILFGTHDICNCESVSRVKRVEDTSGTSFGDMFNNFLSSLFGTSNTDEIDPNVLNSTLNGIITNTNTGNNASGKQDVDNTLSPVTSLAPNETQIINPLPMTTTKVTTTLSTTSMTGSYSSSVSWFDYNGDFPQQEDNPCNEETALQNFCGVPENLVDVTVWDLYSLLFSDTVIDALLTSCTKGTWCLQDRFDYWEALISERVDMTMQSEIATSMCRADMLPCIDSVVTNYYNCSFYGELVYTSSAIKVICELKENTDLTPECFKHMLTALHVTLADVLRQSEDETTDDTCQSPEAQMTRNLICVTNACPDEEVVLNEFRPWAWFTYVVEDLINGCDLDPNKCLAMLQPRTDLIYESELGTMIGVSVATMVTAVVLALMVCVCYKRHRRNVVLKDGYEKLLTEGDES